jgi:hypothetical protein
VPVAFLVVTLLSLLSPPPDVPPADRLDAIRRAQVWTETNVASFDFKAGEGEFAPWSTVTCDHAEKKFSGTTPKFGCAITPGDILKIKYGEDNNEVYAGVAATRLLRALGFGVDTLYPVRVECRGCPAALRGAPAGPSVSAFPVAAIERKMKGKDLMSGGKEGWVWSELDLVDPAAGGAPRAQRDALKLMAVFLQHTDNKMEQQHLICLPAPATTVPGDTAPVATPPVTAPPATTTPASTAPAPCERPFMLMHDLGNTFGEANKFNRRTISGVHLEKWSSAPVWKDAGQCIGNLSKSFTGNLSNPKISEEGRKFLADLLVQLTDAQLHDLFTVAHFAQGPERMRAATGTADATVAAWVDAFKKKRAEIVQAHCPQ